MYLTLDWDKAANFAPDQAEGFYWYQYGHWSQKDLGNLKTKAILVYAGHVWDGNCSSAMHLWVGRKIIPIPYGDLQ